ncbi:TonB-dependent receptor [Dysgonomonas sp. 521]|uniref:TonB-dependent receptor domain-containing protein n=1 Tax=Dysgonomonas sp. 521 TaxID=2302932 RepID=UPI0013D84174|nr:TonB-dependent receptor [Dysgonomonas sp. 521]NDV94625.1 TonB-dependent receptor [Dysgonomonas sp. 521]
MKHLYIILLLSVLPFATLQAQQKNGYIQGVVSDSTTKEPIPYVTIKLLNQTDSAYIKGIATDEKGSFRLAAPAGKYILDVSFIGYKKFLKEFETFPKNPDYSFGDIYLAEDVVQLKEAVVEAKVPDILVKGDTIEYNANSYSSQESDMLQDMMKNIPGVEVDADGNITANGKPVKKILVDGKEFFGNDIPMALANLPANMIKKLQLYKEESETAQVTGFKDKDPDQVLNLVVKEELKQSIFGEVKAGYGSDDKYANKVLVNYMRNDNQMSVVADLNNINDGGGYTLDMNNGIDKNKNLGANAYIQSSDKFRIGGNVRYSGNDNLMETKTNTQTFLSSGDRFSKQEASYRSKRENMNFGMNMQWKPDTLTTIFARSYISFSNTNNRQNSTNLSYVAEKDTTSGYSNSQTKGDGYSINNFITIGRKLNNKGRTISLTLNNSIRKDNNKGTNYSYTTYTDDTEDKIIDQRNKTDNRTNSYNLSMSYVEPLGKDHRLQLSYSYGLNDSKRIRDVRKKDDAGEYTILDSAYARNTNNKYINQNISLNFQTTKEKYNYTIGFSIDPSYSRSKVSIGDSIIENVKQSVVNFSPSLNFSYQPNEQTSLDLSYSGSTSQPGITQLSADTVITSALSKYYGNPDLKPSYSNNFSVYYRKSDYETNRFLMLSGGFNYIFNNIIDYTTIDDLGNSVNTYRNMSGNMGANINFMFNTPLRNKKFTIDNSTYTNYYKNIGYTNAEKAITHNIVIGEKVSGKFKVDKFETHLQLGMTYNITRNNLSSAQDRNTSTYTVQHSFLWKLPYDFSVQNDLNMTYYAGYGDDFKKKEILWNASISKLFLKKKKGTVKLQLFDILNDRNNIVRYVSGNYMSDSRSNSISRYFMLSFSYKFNIIKSKKGGGQDDDYDGEF